jgi:hypothetical protein
MNTRKEIVLYKCFCEDILSSKLTPEKKNVARLEYEC